MSTPPTIYDVALRAGVSISTVSRVLQSSHRVSEHRRALVEAAVAELGYIPSASARGLVARHTGLIGLCFPEVAPVVAEPERALRLSGAAGLTEAAPEVEVVRDESAVPTVAWGNLYFGEVIRGAEHAAWRAGLSVTITVVRGADGASLVQDLAGRVDGLAVVSAALGDELLDHVAHRVPVVVMAGPDRSVDHDRIRVDNERGMAALVRHLVVDHGYTDVRYVGGTSWARDDQERFAGFRSALLDAGLDAPEVPTLRGDYSRAVARELVRGLVEESRRGGSLLPRALVCGNDQMALGVLDVLVEEGVDVPGEVAVTGFDGVDETQSTSPRLTTVQQPMTELGRIAVERLVARIAAPTGAPTTVDVPVRVLLRGSCGTH